MRITKALAVLIFITVCALAALTGCGGSGNGGGAHTVGELYPEPIDPGDQEDNGGGNGDQDLPTEENGELSAIFSGKLGVPISRSSLGLIDPDPTGLNPSTDFDGDGISNNEEVMSNQFVADYPVIVTKISPNIQMDLVVNESSSVKSYSETLSETDIQNTSEQSMDENHYVLANLKTTPVVTKLSNSNNRIVSSEYSIACTQHHGGADYVFNVGELTGQPGTINTRGGTGIDISRASSRDFSSSSSSERTTFPDVKYKDNLDKSGKSMSESAVKRVSSNYKSNAISTSSADIGPNAGIVTAAVTFINTSVNMPVKVSNIKCTLMFKTPAGEFLPVTDTFTLKDAGYNDFEPEIGGGEESGPYSITIKNLNTNMVKKALRNGYLPQIHIVYYDMTKVEDSNYNPGVDNLKMVEEAAKGRTALIKIIGPDMRETYRVSAFDVETGDRLSPGISLKKALFNIFKDQIGSGSITGEDWTNDQNDMVLTVSDMNLKWKPNAPDDLKHTYSSNVEGNKWSMFETYIKTYKDQFNEEHRIETIKRIGELTKYNPFDPTDNTTYNPNELMERDEFFKMKYWIIYHNGRYFDGDINDPIWAGERYEIICVDIGEFNQHFETYSYTPLQSSGNISLNTLWDAVSNENEFGRSVYMGKAVQGEAIHLELDLSNNRMLFDPAVFDSGLGFGEPYQEFTSTDSYSLDRGFAWFNFNYTFGTESAAEGIPQMFKHSATGKTNSILVKLDESTNAAEYDIRVYRASPLFDKTIRISKEELEKNGYVVAINRKTKDFEGSTVGVISEGSYSVNVIARGTAYGVPVTKVSSAGNITVDVISATGTSAGAFSYTATPMTNRIDFQISDANNAEYFLIRCIGPRNPSYGGSTETIAVAHTGYNILEIPNPTEPNDPGIYEIHLYSIINGNENFSSCTESGTGEFILINYDRYINEKESTPKLSTSYFDQRAIDLEVNFNDGSGWYLLKMTSGEEGEDGKTINCLGTNYMEYNKQKFHIYFQPPSGNSYCSYDVFSGGRKEVDVYIRTVAKPEYRYTIWPAKNNALNNYIDSAGRYVYTNVLSTEELPCGDVVQYWMENANTDTSRYEDLLTGKVFADAGTMKAVGEYDFGIVPDTDMNTKDYFFSPAVYRDYSIKASIEEEMTSKPATGAYRPSFKSVGASTSILISDLDYPLNATYTIYYAQGNHLNENPLSWTNITSSGADCEITGLSTYTNYTLCVVANAGGVTSQYAYRQVHTAFNWFNVSLNSPYNYANGAGHFMDSGYLTTSYGVPLRSGQQFTDDMPLDSDQFGLFGGGANIWDTGISGALGDAKYLRMVNAGVNITNTSGLGLIPIAKDLPNFNISPAPVWDSVNSVWRQTAYIDPERGSFILPRPDFWYKCNNLDVGHTTIQSETTPTQSNWNSTYLGVGSFTGLGEKPGIYWKYPGVGTANLFPFGNSVCPDTVTVSFWLFIPNTTSTKPYVVVFFDNTNGTNDYVLIYWYSTAWSNRVYVNNVYGTMNTTLSMTAWRYVYILMSKNAVLTGGKSIRVFVDGTEYMSSTTPLASLGNLGVQIGNDLGTTASAYIYNLKVWKSIVSENPSWEFNGGVISVANYIEDALHPIYGAANGRKPALSATDSPASGVGYYYIPQY